MIGDSENHVGRNAEVCSNRGLKKNFAASADFSKKGIRQRVISLQERETVAPAEHQSMNDESRNEDAEWLRSAVDRHAAALVRYAASIVRDEDVARDVVQETFVRLWRQPRTALDSRLEPWLFRVCRNCALDHRRKEARMSPLEANPARAQPVDDSGVSPASAAEAHDTHLRVLQLMEALPGNQREVVRLKFQNGLSYKEIAEVTELSVSNVGFLLHTALKTLRTRLIAAGE